MFKFHTAVLPKHLFAAVRHERPHIHVSPIVVQSASLDAAAVYQRFATRPEGLTTEFALLGSDVEGMSDEQLAEASLQTTLFARVSPAHKRRIIQALQARQHIVGFMGDGINDAPALRIADVGISVDTAVDIAKESADMILLEKSLLVLEAGVVEGRKVFANILKYVRMSASSNFGNMFSVLGASAFVPFLPMAPIQILANNLLYDISQTAIPTDEVDPEQVEKPRPWDMNQLTRFILFVGPCSSIFDYTTFFIMLIGIALPYSPFGHYLGFTPLPPLYWPLLALTLVGYVVLTQTVKTWLVCRKWI